MQKIREILSVVAVLEFCGSALFAASVENAVPTPTTVSPCAPYSDMSLVLYRSLREKALLLSESQCQPPSAESDGVPLPDPRQVLVQLAGEVREHEAEILSALGSSRSIQRELAARVLSLAADKKSAVDALCTVLESDNDSDVRATAAFTLGRLGDAAAVDTLLGRLRDDNEGVRSQAIAALGQMRDERAVADLMQILRSDLKPLLRLHAAASLALIKSGVSDSDLAGLLSSEADERVKMAIASAIRAISPEKAPGASEIPDQDDYGSRLSELAGVMKGVEQKMRDDRYDEVVQVDQNEIDEKLGDMIQELEKMQRLAIEKQQKETRQQQARRRLAALGQQEDSPRPRTVSRPPPPVGEARVNSGRVVSRGDNWASLPQAERDELLQVFRPEVPLRWRKRLEAYFVSLAAEEARSDKK